MSNKTIKSIAFCVVVIFCIFILIGFNKNSKKIPINTLKVDNKEISLIISDTLASRQQGLSGMESLPENTAMLFKFSRPDKYGIWMKDMNFPIDIVWLDEKFRIVYFEKKVSTSTYPHIFIPPHDSLYIIETKSGFVDENEFEVGNFLNLHI